MLEMNAGAEMSSLEIADFREPADGRFDLVVDLGVGDINVFCAYESREEGVRWCRRPFQSGGTSSLSPSLG